MEKKELSKQEKRAIVIEQFEDFLSSSKTIQSAEDIAKIKKAFALADNAHITQERRAGLKLPYIIHPIAVAKIVTTEMGFGVTTATAALLHDVVEDSKGKYTVEDLEREFGKDVAVIVNGVTKIMEEFDENSSIQVETFKKFINNMAIDKRTAYVKIADRLHNLRTMEGERDNSKMVKTAEALDIYAPLAHGLGLFEIKKEIEDLSFKYREEIEYNKTFIKAVKFRTKRKQYFEEITDQVDTYFSKNNIKFKIEKNEKSLYRAFRKTKDKKLSFSDIHNFITLRIIIDSNNKLPEKQQAYLAFSYLSDLFPVRQLTFKDWITIPKSNGFQALIADIMYKGRWTEVQIMTERMNKVASVGFAEGYENTHIDNLDMWVKSINAILDSERLTNEEVMDLILPQDREVFALTPQGERIKLPKDATVLDFAFKIHSDLGIHFQGAEVNGQLVSYNYKINNNDLVNIIYSKEVEPHEEWLKVLACPHSKNTLKQYINKKKRKVVKIGKEIYSQISEKYKIAEKEMNNVLKKFICSDKDELFYRLANETISEKNIIATIREGRGVFSRMTGMWTGGKQEVIDITTFDPKKSFVIKDFSNIKIGKCCRPIEGDTAIIYKKDHSQFVVHMHECKEAKKLNASDGKKTAKVIWSLINKKLFKTTIKFTGVENKGVLSEMIGVISNENDINMTSLNINSEKNSFQGSIVIQVKDVDILNDALKRMRKIKYLKKIYRVTEY